MMGNMSRFHIRPARPDETGLFYTPHPEEDRRRGTIGHVRMDFGRSGNEFWHTWWPRGPEDSLERLIYSAKCQFADDAEGVEDAVIRKDNLFRLRAALDQLSEEERALIHALFFDERSERELEEMMGVHRMTIHNRKIRILQKLKKMLR